MTPTDNRRRNIPSPRRAGFQPAAGLWAGSAACAILLLTAVKLHSAAQRPLTTSEPQVISVGTRLVQVDVLVTEKARDKSTPVLNLTREDFTLLDQGQPQQIAVFLSAAQVRSAALAQAAAAPPLPPGAISNRLDHAGRPVPGATVILLDLINTPLDDQGYARAQLLKYLATLHGHDQIAIYALGKALHVIHDFTDDPQVLVQAVQKFDPRLSELLMISQENMDGIDKDMVAMSDEYYSRVRFNTTDSALAKIAEHLSGMSGRKSLIWLSDAPASAGVQYLSRANINVYPVQVRTVASSGVIAWINGGPRAILNPIPTGPELEIGRRNRAIAAARGGVAFADAADIGQAVAQSEEDATHTYTLGFYPSEESLDGKIHALSISVNGRPAKSIDLRYRPSYFAAPRQQQRIDPAKILAATAEAAVHNVLSSPLNATDIGLAALSGSPTPGSYRVAVTVDLHNLHFEREPGPTGKFIAAIEVNWLIEGATSLRTETAKIALTEAQLTTALQNGLTVASNFEAPGDNPAVRVVVRDRATGSLGSLRVPLTKMTPLTK